MFNDGKIDDFGRGRSSVLKSSEMRSGHARTAKPRAIRCCSTSSRWSRRPHVWANSMTYIISYIYMYRWLHMYEKFFLVWDTCWKQVPYYLLIGSDNLGCYCCLETEARLMFGVALTCEAVKPCVTGKSWDRSESLVFGFHRSEVVRVCVHVYPI